MHLNNIRLIARLDVKGSNLIKGVHLEGLRTIGDPNVFAKRYYEQGADEIIYMDVVASLYGRNKLTDIVSHTSKNIFIPLTVGGGIRTLNDVHDLLEAGADKVAINTAAVQNPLLISEISQRFGSQCMVLSIEAKYQSAGKWEAYTECGRERTGLDVVEWAKRGVELGAGEILITSIDREGTRSGFDNELVNAITASVNIPVIASGGYGDPEHLDRVINYGRADAVAFADALHYNRVTFDDLRRISEIHGIPVRAP
jgi:imidazole glycerol-phosphate synthase subunit HisF